MSGRRESIGRLASRKQSAAGPPTQEFVSVAVLPPRLPANMAPPTGLGPAEALSWDERLNWRHNEAIQEESSGQQKQKRKGSFLKRAGLTTERQARNNDNPPFTFRQVPYDVWRKHYAKDAQGNYRGTHAPAEDCLLKPDDVAKWRLGEAKTMADLWTRGSEALPVYHEVHAEGSAPDYDGIDAPPYQDTTAVTANPIASGAEPHLGESGSVHHAPMGRGETDPNIFNTDDYNEPERNGSNASALSHTTTTSSQHSQSAVEQSQPLAPGRRLINGKTAEQIIAEEKEKNKNRPKGNMTWKQRVKRGTEYALMGTNA